MNKVAITTNSACVSAEEARNHGFKIIPFHIIIDGKDYLDPEVDMESLYARLDKKQSLPTTSTPTLVEFLQVFTELSQSAEAILHISMSQAFTGAYSLALQAKEAAEAAAQGKNLNEIMELVNHMIPRITQLSSRDTLFYLDKGGRVFEAKSWAEAESLNSFRAIVEIDASSGGTTKPVARAKTKIQIMNRMVGIAGKKKRG